MADKYRNEVLAFCEAIKGNIFYVFDTETTGLKCDENDIIEFSALKCRGEDDGTVTSLEELDIFINPGYSIPPIITELTGITDEMVKDCPNSKEAAVIVSEFLGDDPILMGYNSVSFDAAFMRVLYQKINKTFDAKVHLDVLKMAKEKTPKPHKLIDMANAAGIADGLAFHTSIDDAKATLGVFKYLLPMYKEKEATPELTSFKITGVQRWKKSETLDRIYVNNTMRVSVYYDIVNKCWEIGGNLPDAEVISAVFSYKGVSSVEELLLIL